MRTQPWLPATPDRSWLTLQTLQLSVCCPRTTRVLMGCMMSHTRRWLPLCEAAPLPTGAASPRSEEALGA